MSIHADVDHLCRRAGLGATEEEPTALCTLGSIEDVVNRILDDPRHVAGHHCAFDPPVPNFRTG
jgi:hypothetical protein